MVRVRVERWVVRASGVALALAALACSEAASPPRPAADGAMPVADTAADTAADAVADSAVDASLDGSPADVPEAVDAGAPAPERFARPGPYAVGQATRTVVDPARDRTLRVEVWYPAEAGSGTGEPVPSLAGSAEDQVRYASLLSSAPEACPTRTTGAARDAVALSGPWPLVVFSHCADCVRFSSLSVAERLASHGVMVAAPDHAGGTLFDDLDGQSVGLTEAFLQTRRADLSVVLDALLASDFPGVPQRLRGLADPDRIGALGHSFGSVTAGLTAQDDPRITAVAGIAAPMANPLLPGVDMARLTLPLLYLVAREDNSITEFGNLLIRETFAAAPGPAWKVEVDDAGHWSFSDLCGLHDAFMPGCGEDTRQTDGTPFTYLPVSDGIAVAQTWVTAFFRAHLADDPSGAQRLAGGADRPGITVDARPIP